MANAKKTPIEILWNNDAAAITLQPTQEGAAKGAEGVTVEVQIGKTDDEKQGTRFRAFVGSVLIIEKAASAKALANSLVKKHGGPNGFGADAFEVDKFLSEIAEAFDLDVKAPEKAWDEGDSADALKALHVEANKHAEQFLSADTNMREGIYGLARDLCNARDTLKGDKKAFDAWCMAAPEPVQKATASKNGVAEFEKIGRYPREFVFAQKETTNSPKAFQYNFNQCKSLIADAIAGQFWRDCAGKATPAELQSLMLTYLDDKQGWNVTVEQVGKGKSAKTVSKRDSLKDISELSAQQILVRSFLEHLTGVTADGEFDFFEVDDNGKWQVARVDGKDAVIPLQFGTSKQPHELLNAVASEVNAQSPAKVAEAEEKEAEKEAVDAIRPKTFAEYGVQQAAIHLARILSVRDTDIEEGETPDAMDVLTAMQAIAESAQERGWTDALADAQQAVDESAAQEADEAAEGNAADAA